MKILSLLSLILGLLYPLTIMLIGQILFPYQANGSLIKHRGKIIGSSLIAQEFNSYKYFHSRFSAIKYNATSSGASNLAPSNKILYQKTKQRVRQMQIENSLQESISLPADMVFSSASGLDPHISFANAMLQLPRVAKERNLPKEAIKRLVQKHLENDFIGIWGEAGVNVLELNLELDSLK